MILDGISLVEYNSQYMMVDYPAKKPVIISKRVYEILSKAKSGIPISLLEESYGHNLVDTVWDTLDNLKKRKVLEFADRDFYKECKMAISRYAEQDMELLEGNIMISQDCNMACRYCYGGMSGMYNQKGLMTIEMAEQCFRYLLSCGGNRAFQKTVFFGGEPLLNMPVIKHIVMTWEKIKNQYHGREMYFTLTTNGTLLTPEIVEFFKDYNIIVNVSLDGPKDIHDANRVLASDKASFDKVMQGIDLMRKYGLPISIRSTVTNGTDLSELQKFFEQENFDIHSIDMVDYPMLHPKKPFQFDISSYADFLEQQRKIVNAGCEDIYKGEKNSFNAKQMSSSYQRAGAKEYPFLCGAGNWFIAVGLDGYIYPCTRLVGNEKFRIGDINTGLCKDKMVSLWEKFLEVSKDCVSCWVVSRCHGKCFHQKLNEDNQMEPLPKELCDVYKKSLADSLLFTAQMKKYMEERREEFKEAVIRYDADHMMETIREDKKVKNEPSNENKYK